MGVCAKMSLFNSYTELEVELLKDHGLYTGGHSQLSDAFVIGYRKSQDGLNKIKAEAVRDYEASLSSFDWTAEEYIENMLWSKKMNNFERQDAIDGLIAKHTARELAGMVVDKSSRYEQLMEHGLICDECGGQGFLGNPPDDFYDCPKCIASTNKIKVEAVREAVEWLHVNYAHLDGPHLGLLTHYANQLDGKQ
jgi:hypothetical protein